MLEKGGWKAAPPTEMHTDAINVTRFRGGTGWQPVLRDSRKKVHRCAIDVTEKRAGGTALDAGTGQKAPI